MHQRLNRQQLSVAKATFVEPTEEVRVIWLDIMLHIASEQRDISATQVEKALDILQLAIRDTTPDVQKKGGKALTELAKQHRKEIALAGERPMRMILDLLHHKHSALRVIGLEVHDDCHAAFVYSHIHWILISALNNWDWLFLVQFISCLNMMTLPNDNQSFLCLYTTMHLWCGWICYKWPVLYSSMSLHHNAMQICLCLSLFFYRVQQMIWNQSVKQAMSK